MIPSFSSWRPDTRHIVVYRGLVIFVSQLALFPTFSIVSSHMDAIDSGVLLSSLAASIGPLGLCLAAFLIERLHSTTHECVAAQILNACGILACTLGLLFDRPLVWTMIMLLTGLSDVSPFINKTSGMCGESQQLIRISGALYLVFDMLGTGSARLFGGLLRDGGWHAPRPQVYLGAADHLRPPQRRIFGVSLAPIPWFTKARACGASMDASMDASTRNRSRLCSRRHRQHERHQPYHRIGPDRSRIRSRDHIPRWNRTHPETKGRHSEGNCGRHTSRAVELEQDPGQVAR